MNDLPMRWTPILLPTLILLLFGLLSLEAGFRLGRRDYGRFDERRKGQANTVLGGVFGLLGLLLAFSFALAQSRFDHRRHLVVKEANIIGTTYLRTEALPEPQRGRLRGLLKEYLGTRIEALEALYDSGDISRVLEKAERLQDNLWQEAVVLMQNEPRVVPTGLFVDSMNNLIDVQTERIRAFAETVPLSMHVLLTLSTTMALGLLGYGFGLDNRRNAIPSVMLALFIAAVVLITLDFDHPTAGLIRASQEPIMRLWQSMNAR